MADEPVVNWTLVLEDGTEQIVTGFDLVTSPSTERAVSEWLLTDPAAGPRAVVVSQSPANPVLPGDQVLLTAKPAGGVSPLTYSWVAPTGAPVLSGSGASRTFIVPAGTPVGTVWAYTVVVTDATGGQASGQVSVGVGDVPPPPPPPLTAVMSLAPANPLTAGSSATLTVTGSGGLPPYAVVWAAPPPGAPALSVVGNRATFTVPAGTANGATWVYSATLTGAGSPSQSVTASFTVKVAAPVAVTTKMGTSINHGAGGLPKWDVARIYTYGKANTAVNTYGAKILALTDNATANAGGQASANKLDAALETIFTAHPNVEVHFAFGNEISRPDHYPNLTSYRATYAAGRKVIDKHRALGRKCSLWIDLTHHVIETDPGAIAGLRDATADFLDGVASSMYPPGRDDHPTSFTDFQSFLDPVVQVAVDWGIPQLAAWEIATSRDVVAAHTTVPVRVLGTGIVNRPVSGYEQSRPTYAAYMAKYIVDKAASVGVAVPVLCWWDSSGNPYNPNTAFSDRFDTDTVAAPWTAIPATAPGQPPQASPSTAQAWHDWPSWIGVPQ